MIFYELGVSDDNLSLYIKPIMMSECQSTPSSGSSKRPTKESSQENLRKLTFDRGEAK